MIRFAYEETIAASSATVFAVMSDITRFNEWLDMDGRPTSPATGLGARFESSGRMGPLRIKGTGEVDRFEPDRAFGFRMTVPGAFDFDLQLELEPIAEGTRLRGRGAMTTHRWWRLLEPVLRSEVQAGEAREARRLKELLEAGR